MSYAFRLPAYIGGPLDGHDAPLDSNRRFGYYRTDAGKHLSAEQGDRALCRGIRGKGWKPFYVLQRSRRTGEHLYVHTSFFLPFLAGNWLDADHPARRPREMA